MKTKIGIIMVTISFLGSSYVAVESEKLEWGKWITLITVGIIGIYLIKRSSKEEILKVLEEDFSLEDLKKVLKKATKEAENIHSVDPKNYPKLIEENLSPLLSEFASHRELIKAELGIKKFGEIFSHFAAGERYANRAWSAAVDEYYEEAKRALQLSLSELKETLTLLETVN